MGKTVVVACGLSVGVFAQVCYAADAVRVHHDEELFPLTEVRLTGGPLQAQQEQTRKYLLRLEPDRLLCRFRSEAGLEPKAKHYGGWEAPAKSNSHANKEELRK